MRIAAYRCGPPTRFCRATERQWWPPGHMRSMPGDSARATSAGSATGAAKGSTSGCIALAHHRAAAAPGHALVRDHSARAEVYDRLIREPVGAGAEPLPHVQREEAAQPWDRSAALPPAHATN